MRNLVLGDRRSTREPGRTVSNAILLSRTLLSLSTQPLLRLFRGLMVLYIFLLVVLPSGSIFGFNVKILCFTLLLPLAAQVALAKGQITRLRLAKLLLVPSMLVLWIFLSQLYGFDLTQALAQYKDLLVTLCTCWFAAVLCQRNVASARFLLHCIIYVEMFASFLKLVMLAYAYSRGIPVSVVIEWIHLVFNVQLMPFDFASALGRIQFISDNLIPVCLFSIVCFRHELSLRARRALLLFFLLIVSDLFTFSRYLWVFTALALVLGLLAGKKDRFQAALLALMFSLVAVSLPFLIAIITLRFSLIVISSSDADRIQQVAALQVFIGDARWFGHGLGSYSHSVIRSLEAPYSYEAQLLALVGQVGIVGVAFLAILTASYFRGLWFKRHSGRMRSFALAVLLGGWFVGGFFNPSVISSAASVSYAAIFAMSVLLDCTPN